MVNALKLCSPLPLREPVSPEEAEDYLDIISEPMDFQTMQGKFTQGSYHHPQDFLEDMKLVFSNSEEYNQQGSTVLSCTIKTEQAFVELLQKQLPGLSYLRRRVRKRVCRVQPSSEEDDEEEEEPPPKKKQMQNGKQSRKGSRNNRSRKDEESEEDEDDEEEDERNSKRRSKRTTVTSGRKDYREQDSDGERDSRRTHQRGCGASGDGDRSNQQRHSKRQKRS